MCSFPTQVLSPCCSATALSRVLKAKQHNEFTELRKGLDGKTRHPVTPPIGALFSVVSLSFCSSLALALSQNGDQAFRFVASFSQAN